MTYYAWVESPIASILLCGDGDFIDGIYLRKQLSGRLFQRIKDARLDESMPAFKEAKKQLAEYFYCKRQDFELPLKLNGTDFQMKVWKELQKIPYAATISYLRLACLLGNSRACRAVAAANARNPLSIVIPCHRVLGSDGSLTGYAGGLEEKRYLLDLEKRLASAQVR